jgi:hypothetical protein
MVQFYQEQLITDQILINRKLENMQVHTLNKIDNTDE